MIPTVHFGKEHSITELKLLLCASLTAHRSLRLRCWLNQQQLAALIDLHLDNWSFLDEFCNYGTTFCSQLEWQKATEFAALTSFFYIATVKKDHGYNLKWGFRMERNTSCFSHFATVFKDQNFHLSDCIAPIRAHLGMLVDCKELLLQMLCCAVFFWSLIASS